MILRRYLVREVTTTFAAVIAALMLVFVAGRFADFLATAATGRIDPAFILELLLLRCVDALATLLPAALFAALVIALGRLDRDHEIVAMAAGGLGRAHLAGTVLLLGAGAAMVAGVLSLIAAPGTNQRYESLKAHARESAEVSQVAPGRFIRIGRNAPVFYVERLSGDRRTMERVFMHASHGGAAPSRGAASSGRADEVIFAPRARYLAGPDGPFVVIEDGRRYVGTPGEGEWSITRFGRYTIRVPPDDSGAVERSVESMPTPRLWNASGADRAAAAELQWRLSLPVLTVVLAGIAFPLALSGTARGPFERVVSGVASYLAYFGLVIAAVKAVESGDLSPALGVWPVHAGFAAIAAVLGLRSLHPLRRGGGRHAA